MTTITISVIIPTYNRAHLLPRALKSVFSQTYTNFEVIVVDDASTDNTSTIVNDFDSQRIHYIRHEDNLGVAAARNTGLMPANGKYIAFLDSDDAWLPWKLEKQLAAMEASSIHTGMIYSPAVYLKGDKVQLVPASVSRKCGNVYSDVMRFNFFAFIQASLIKSECFERVGLFDSKMRGTDDLDMLIRITKYFDVCCVDELTLPP